MDPNRTPKRKRKRAGGSTSDRSGGPSSASSSRSSRTPGTGGAESTIVWKDSPVEKQIRVSGTGKMAVRKEMQGFVGRLARASAQSPSPSAGKGAARRERPLHGLTKRKAGATARGAFDEKSARPGRPHGRERKPKGVLQYDDEGDSAAATSRHLIFSPDGDKPDAAAINGKSPQARLHPSRLHTPSPRGRRRDAAPDNPESRDEFIDILEEMEQKYASPEVAAPVTSAPTDAPPPRVGVVTADGTISLSYSSTGTLSPGRKEASTPNTPTQASDTSFDFGGPLTDEWFAEVDKMVEQASQRVAVGTSQQPAEPEAQAQAQAQSQTQTQTEICSSQSLALTPRPLPPSSSSYAAPKAGSRAAVTSSASTTPSASPSASAVRTLKHADAIQELEGPGDYGRFLVLEVDRDVFNRCLLLRLLDDHEAHVEAVLMADWYDTVVEAGDTINIVFTEKDADGFFSQEPDASSKLGRARSSTAQIQVDNEHNVVVVHPDILVSPTSVTTGFGCLRRAILRETLPVGRPTHPKAFLGTLKHELFERGLLKPLLRTDALLEEAKKIVDANTLGLVECGLTEEKAMLELRSVAKDYQRWLDESIRGPGVQSNEPPPKVGARIRLSRVLATEEIMWSIKWGLKGATDASVEATIAPQKNGNTVGKKAGGGDQVVVPLELKTGSKVYAGVEHHGQVILYTLLLNERYRQRCQDGLLLYAPGIETNRIAAMASHVRGLIMSRNNFASAMAKIKAVGSSTSSQVFPPMLRSRRDCERCFQVDECLLHHAATENGTKDSSGLEELFTQKTNHLTETDLAYFKQWNRLIDLEQQHAERNLRALWLQVGWKREQAQESSTCIAHLQLVSDDPAHSESGAKRMLRFGRDTRQRSAGVAPAAAPPGGEAQVPLSSFAGVRFRVDERVILSAESLDGKKLLVHIAKATIRAIEHDVITVETRQCIPSIVISGKSVVGNEFTWRLDKDAIMSGLRRAKENLVRLFVGPPPETVSVGTALSSRPELQVLMKSAAHPFQGGASGKNNGVPSSGDTRRRNLIVHLSRPRFKSCRVSELVTQHCTKFADTDSGVRVAAQGKALMDAFFQLNIDQQRAVQRVLSSLDYALVLGMPGTGKTATIAFTVRVLLFFGFSVLVTSYTHSAVDNLLLKLFACNLPMLRIGNPAQVHPMLAEFTLDQQAQREGIASVDAMESKMTDAKLVGCTCLSVNSHVLFAKRRFDFCIVDEATQITQPVVTGALRCADTFVLVGDHYQLPPLVANSQAQNEGMGVSLFRRLAEAHPEASQQLSYQYRMNRDVTLLANRLVYGNKLKCGSFSVASNYLAPNWKLESEERQGCGSGSEALWPSQVLTQRQGVVFLDTDTMGGEAAESSSASQRGTTGRRRTENVAEAQVIAGLVEILVLGAVPAGEVAVISPFRSQVALIERELARIARSRGTGGREWLQKLEVSTIDKYQGKDKDVILVSFVRCNPEKRVGELLTDWRRINVALTRAKQKLVLVGSRSTLSGGSALFRVLSEVVEERQWMYNLPRDAVETLERFAASVSGRAAEPEPEGDAETGPRMRRAMPRDGVEVSVMQHAPASHDGDIEALVPSSSTVPLHSRRGTARSHPLPLKPIAHDIYGEL